MSYESGRRPTSPLHIQTSSGCTPVPRPKTGRWCCWRGRREPARARWWCGCSSEAGVCSATMSCRLMSNRQAALPLPFTPDVRTTPSADLDDERAFVEQPKQVVAIPADRVARQPGPIGAIVFPAYDRDRDARPSLAPMSVVSAAEALARAFAHPTSDTRGLVAGVFRLAQRIACYRLDYRDSTAAAAALAQPRACAFEVGSST